MGHSRHSQSRHELVSSHGQKSSSDERAETMAKHKRGNMKCIITVGILLPILAAIIGVAAWAVSGDSDRHGSSHSNTHHRPSFQRGHISRFHNDLVPVLEERNDLLYDSGKVPIGGAVSKDILGTETVHEDEDNQIHLHADDYAAKPPISSSSEHPKDDPLYVVHYVPPEIKPELSTPPSEASTSHGHGDILSKILSTGKGANKGTPQFVVFAPLPGEMGEKNSRKGFGADYDYDANEPQARAGSKRIRVKKMRKGRKNDSFDDELDPPVSSTGKNRNRGSSHHQTPVLPRNGPYYSDNRPSLDQSYFQDDDDRFQQGQYESNNPIPYNQQNQMGMNHMPMQYQQGMMGGHQQGQVMCCLPKPGRPNKGFGQQMQMQQMQQPMQQQMQQPMQQPMQQQNQNIQPGLTISLGNGNPLPLGPLGMLRQLLRPTMDLRKKMFFGVQLENGFGLGRNNNNAGGTDGGGGGGINLQLGGGDQGRLGGNPNMMNLYNG